jgi:hypothetical protein
MTHTHTHTHTDTQTHTQRSSLTTSCVLSLHPSLAARAAAITSQAKSFDCNLQYRDSQEVICNSATSHVTVQFSPKRHSLHFLHVYFSFVQLMAGRFPKYFPPNSLEFYSFPYASYVLSPFLCRQLQVNCIYN